MKTLAKKFFCATMFAVLNFENLILIGLGVERLNKEFGISRSGHATVTASNFAFMSLENFFWEGANVVKTWSQENCLIDNRRLTCEWQEWRFYFAWYIFLRWKKFPTCVGFFKFNFLCNLQGKYFFGLLKNFIASMLSQFKFDFLRIFPLK